MSRRRLGAQLQGGLGRDSVTLAGIHRDALCSLSNSGSHPAFKYFHLLIKPSKLQSWGNVCGQTLFQRKIVGSQLKMSLCKYLSWLVYWSALDYAWQRDRTDSGAISEFKPFALLKLQLKCLKTWGRGSLDRRSFISNVFSRIHLCCCLRSLNLNLVRNKEFVMLWRHTVISQISSRWMHYTVNKGNEWALPWKPCGSTSIFNSIFVHFWLNWLERPAQPTQRHITRS